MEELRTRHGVIGRLGIQNARFAGKIFVNLIELMNDLKPKLELDKSKIKKFLAIQLYGFGDYLMSTPALRAIKQEFPSAQLELLCTQDIKQVAELNPEVSKAMVFEKEKLKELLTEKYDLIVQLNNSVESELIALKLKPKHRIGYFNDWNVKATFKLASKQKFEPCSKESWVEMYCKIAKAMGLKCESNNYVLKVGEKEKKKAIQLLGNFKNSVGINAGARKGAECKAWNNEKWAELANKLIERKQKIVFIGSKQDNEEIKKIISEIENKERVLDLSGKTSLQELPAVIEKLKALITIDSGPMHLGFAVNTPVIALFGQTSPERLFKKDGRNEAVASKAKNSGTYFKGQLPSKKENNSMNAIEVQEVLKATLKVLK